MSEHGRLNKKLSCQTPTLQHPQPVVILGHKGVWLSDTVPFYCYVGTLPSSFRINTNYIIKHCLKYAKIWVSSNLSFPHKERNENSVLTRKNTPVGIYFLKVNNRNTKTKCEICSKLTIKTPEQRQWRPSGVFVVNFEHISHFVLLFLLLTLNM